MAAAAVGGGGQSGSSDRGCRHCNQRNFASLLHRSGALTAWQRPTVRSRPAPARPAAPRHRRTHCSSPKLGEARKKMQIERGSPLEVSPRTTHTAGACHAPPPAHCAHGVQLPVMRSICHSCVAIYTTQILHQRLVLLCCAAGRPGRLLHLLLVRGGTAGRRLGSSCCQACRWPCCSSCLLLSLDALERLLVPADRGRPIIGLTFSAQC